MSCLPATRLAATFLVAGLLLSACRDPEVPVATPPTAAPTTIAPGGPGPAADVPDPRDQALDAEARDLLATLTLARTTFEGLGRATSLEEAAADTAGLLAMLSANPQFQDPDGDGVPAEVGVRPLLPGPLTSREETIDYGDVFTSLLAVGREVGAAGAGFVDVLRDPIVGDLGSWQRDPEGMTAGITSVVSGVRDVPSAEAAITELQGEGPRALAWAILANRTRDLAQLQAYGERGAVHVGLMVDAVRALVDGA